MEEREELRWDGLNLLNEKARSSRKSVLAW